jgi:hypothetical protein
MAPCAPPAAHGVPANPVLDVRDECQRGGSTVGVGAVVRGEPVEQLDQAGIPEERGVDGVEGPKPVQPGQAREQGKDARGDPRRGLVEAAGQEEGRGRLKESAGMSQVRADTLRRVGGGSTCLPREPLRVAPGREHGAVVIVVRAERVYRFQGDVILEALTCGREEIAEDVGHCKERGTGVETVPAALEGPCLAAGHLLLLENLDRVPPRGQPDGGSHATEPGADDYDAHAHAPLPLPAPVPVRGSSKPR